MALVIRAGQMAALQHDSDVRWYEGQLADLYPPFAAAPFAQRRRWIEEGIKRALAFDLNRSELLQFLSFEQTFSPGCLDLPSFEWARRILSEPDRTSAARAMRLRRESIRRLLEIEKRAAEDETDKRAEALVDAAR